MPIAMIAAGTTSVHQNSGEFFLNIELSTSVFMIIVLAAFSSCHVSGELVEGMSIVDSAPWALAAERCFSARLVHTPEEASMCLMAAPLSPLDGATIKVRRAWSR